MGKGYSLLCVWGIALTGRDQVTKGELERYATELRKLEGKPLPQGQPSESKEEYYKVRRMAWTSIIAQSSRGRFIGPECPTWSPKDAYFYVEVMLLCPVKNCPASCSMSLSES